jgi:methyl-accepting chemotaxis protein
MAEILDTANAPEAQGGEEGETFFSLKLKFIAFIISVIFMLTVIYGWFFLSQSRKVLLNELIHRGMVMTKNLAVNSKFGVMAEDKIVLNQQIDAFFGDTDVSYVIIADKNKRVIVDRFKKEEMRSEINDIIENATDSPEPQFREIKPRSGGGYYNIFLSVLRVKSQKETGSGFLEGAFGEDLSAGSAAEKKEELVAKKADEVVIEGLVQVGISTEKVNGEFRRLAGYGALIALLNFGILGMIMLFFVAFFVGPITTVANKSSMIADGDLTQRVDIKSNDELGQLARAFNKMSSNLSDLFKRIRSASEKTGQMSRDVSKVSKDVYEGSNLQRTSMGEVLISHGGDKRIRQGHRGEHGDLKQLRAGERLVHPGDGREH